ncbi:hypothetical protein M595_1376 [Lyngbya aestuarii BL J]|uniref:Uncharacterized protein n=1 Tax=Lyngbya aestuarii BL J TaxID=1348334 RepID=U7QL71_9CYAN|nr:hypothetical protein M595_1376 [Lyngbya aestuarii BL J]
MAFTSKYSTQPQSDCYMTHLSNKSQNNLYKESFYLEFKKTAQ